jgi:hypothetical protein
VEGKVVDVKTSKQFLPTVVVFDTGEGRTESRRVHAIKFDDTGRIKSVTLQGNRQEVEIPPNLVYRGTMAVLPFAGPLEGTRKEIRAEIERRRLNPDPPKETRIEDLPPARPSPPLTIRRGAGLTYEPMKGERVKDPFKGEREIPPEDIETDEPLGEKAVAKLRRLQAQEDKPRDYAANVKYLEDWMSTWQPGDPDSKESAVKDNWYPLWKSLTPAQRVSVASFIRGMGVRLAPKVLRRHAKKVLQDTPEDVAKLAWVKDMPPEQAERMGKMLLGMEPEEIAPFFRDQQSFQQLATMEPRE